MAYLCTADQLRFEANTNDNVSEGQLLDCIRWASARIEYIADINGLDVEPQVKSRYYDAESTQRLYLSRCLGESFRVTDGAGVEASPEDCRFIPREQPPYNNIVRLNATWAAYADSPVEAIEVNGVWAWHRHYPKAHVQTTTLTAALDDGELTAEVAAVTGLAVGQLIRMGDEYCRIEAIDTDTKVLTLERGANGSEVAAHDTAAAVYRWQPDDLIERACIKAAAYCLARRGAFETASYDGLGTTSYPADLPGEVKNILEQLPTVVAITLYQPFP